MNATDRAAADAPVNAPVRASVNAAAASPTAAPLDAPTDAAVRWLAVHRDAHTSLATGRFYLGADELSACESALALLARLEQLAATRQAQLDAARDAAHEAGFAAGRAEALQATGPALLAAWRQAGEDARDQADALRAAVVELSLQVVQRIAADLAPADVVAGLARRAAQSLLPDQPAVVRVHPELAAAVTTELASPLLDVRADAGLAPLACVLETPTGQLLAGLDTQLAKVGDALREAARSTGPAA